MSDRRLRVREIDTNVEDLRSRIAELMLERNKLIKESEEEYLQLRAGSTEGRA